MRKILLTLGIVLAIYYFFQYRENNSAQKLLSQKLTTQTVSSIREVSKSKHSAQDLKIQENTQAPPLSSTERNEKMDTIPQIPMGKNEQIHFKNKSLYELANEKNKIPITEELKRAKDFKIWNNNEIQLTGKYQGQVFINGKAYTVKLNLFFNPTSSMIQPSSCISMHDSQSFLIKQLYADGEMTLMRMPEEHYFIIAFKNHYFFQVFEIQGAHGKSLITHLTTKNHSAPIVFELSFMRGKPDGCE